jgi:hypothetical protein
VKYKVNLAASPSSVVFGESEKGTKESPPKVDGISSKPSSMMACEFNDSTSFASLGNDAPIT